MSQVLADLVAHCHRCVEAIRDHVSRHSVSPWLHAIQMVMRQRVQGSTTAVPDFYLISRVCQPETPPTHDTSVHIHAAIWSLAFAHTCRAVADAIFRSAALPGCVHALLMQSCTQASPPIEPPMLDTLAPVQQPPLPVPGADDSEQVTWPARLFDVVMQHQGRRQQQGMFFTPPALVDLALDCVGDRVRTIGTPTRVLDPSCGSGAFLLAAMSRTVSAWQSSTHAQGECVWDDGAALARHIRAAAGACLGWDIDGDAASACRFGLAMVMLPAVRRVCELGKGALLCEPGDGPLFATIRTCDALKRYSQKKGPCDAIDVVVGNPPFVRRSGNTESFAFTRKAPWTAMGRQLSDAQARAGDGWGKLRPSCMNMYAWFMLMSARLCRSEGGVLAMVAPPDWLGQPGLVATVASAGVALRWVLHFPSGVAFEQSTDAALVVAHGCAGSGEVDTPVAPVAMMCPPARVQRAWKARRRRRHAAEQGGGSSTAAVLDLYIAWHRQQMLLAPADRQWCVTCEAIDATHIARAFHGGFDGCAPTLVAHAHRWMRRGWRTLGDVCTITTGLEHVDQTECRRKSDVMAGHALVCPAKSIRCFVCEAEAMAGDAPLRGGKQINMCDSRAICMRDRLAQSAWVLVGVGRTGTAMGATLSRFALLPSRDRVCPTNCQLVVTPADTTHTHNTGRLGWALLAWLNSGVRQACWMYAQPSKHKTNMRLVYGHMLAATPVPWADEDSPVCAHLAALGQIAHAYALEVQRDRLGGGRGNGSEASAAGLGRVRWAIDEVLGRALCIAPTHMALVRRRFGTKRPDRLPPLPDDVLSCAAHELWPVWVEQDCE